MSSGYGRCSRCGGSGADHTRECHRQWAREQLAVGHMVHAMSEAFRRQTESLMLDRARDLLGRDAPAMVVQAQARCLMWPHEWGHVRASEEARTAHECDVALVAEHMASRGQVTQAEAS